MPRPLSSPSLPSQAYYDPHILDVEKEHLFRTHWQWVGIIEQLKTSEGIKAEVAGLPVAIKGEVGSLFVEFNTGQRSKTLEDAVADTCGRFVFARLTLGGPTLKEYLSDYVELLQHCSDNFCEVYHSESVEWDCNWKTGLEVTLEGYHVPVVHAVDKKKKKSNLVGALPKGLKPQYVGPHSYQCGIMSDQMKEEMTNIAKRLKITQSPLYNNYDHFTIFPNMTVGISGGNLCFLQIYNPISPNRLRLSYIYIMAKQTDPDKAPVAMIKSTLLNTWRDFTRLVLGEDKEACEMFQLGIRWNEKPGLLGRKAEERVVHFQEHWRQVIKKTNSNIAA